MSVLLLILGFALLAVTSSDVLLTTLTLKGGGFLTNRFSSWVWHWAIKLHKIKQNHGLLAGVGLLIIVGMAVSWFFLTWVSWSLVFCSFDNAILNSSNKEPASAWGRIYFTIYTITTLGRGDYLAGGLVWHLFTGLAAANGFFLVTLSIAFFFPVVSALTQQRTLAVYISSLGGTADEILTRAWNGSDFGNLDQHLISLASMIAEMGEKHLTYPILYYFHTKQRSRCLPLSIAAFDKAMTLLQYALPANCKPDPAALSPARRASAAFLNTLKSAYLEPSNHVPASTPLELLRDRDIPTVSDRAFIEATSNINHRRRLLMALIKNDGWTWDAIASSRTTNRATNLDDETEMNDLVLH